MTKRATILAASLLALVSLVLSAPLGAGGDPPVCDVGGPYPCTGTIRFDGTRSYDPDGTIVSYTWDFGDGQAATGGVVTHHFSALGTYLVTLTVIDNSSLSSNCQVTIEVDERCPDANCPPVCNAGGPYQGVTGEPVQFDGSGSVSVTTCLIALHEWDFGDGATGVGEQPTHAYSAPGTFIVTLTVTDYEAASSTCNTTVEIVDPSAIEPATWGRIKHRMEN